MFAAFSIRVEDEAKKIPRPPIIKIPTKFPKKTITNSLIEISPFQNARIFPVNKSNYKAHTDNKPMPKASAPNSPPKYKFNNPASPIIIPAAIAR